MENKALKDGTTAFGILLIVLGLVFFLATQGFLGLEWGTIWPIFPSLAGAGLITVGMLSQDRGARTWLVFAGTIPLLIGLYFFLVSTGVLERGATGRLWPVFPLIVGIAFFAGFLASGMRYKVLLMPGIVLVAFALTFLSLLWTRTSFEYLGRLWPLALIVIGVALLATRMLGQQGKLSDTTKVSTKAED
jgi:hypothetical protein